MIILEQLKKTDKRLASNLNYEGIEFPVDEKIFKKFKYKIIYALMYLVMRMA